MREKSGRGGGKSHRSSNLVDDSGERIEMCEMEYFKHVAEQAEIKTANEKKRAQQIEKFK